MQSLIMDGTSKGLSTSLAGGPSSLPFTPTAGATNTTSHPKRFEKPKSKSTVDAINIKNLIHSGAYYSTTQNDFVKEVNIEE